MNRRGFIQLSSSGLAALLAGSCRPDDLPFSIQINTNMPAGHLLMADKKWPKGKPIQIEYLIVGGGMAGLSAAWQLQDHEFLVCELSDHPGGSSSGSVSDNQPLCFGAHYDLSYPTNFGPEVLNMMASIGVINFDDFTHSWLFTDRHYIIPKKRQSHTFAYGTFRQDVTPEGPEKATFQELMKGYVGRLPMPTRLIDKELRYLNDLSFADWLQQQATFSTAFMQGVDYQMKDDYGGGASTVSALAGIHYYACRPYYSEPVELFSPPEGNYYFIRKLLDALPQDQIIYSHLVQSIEQQRHGFKAILLDIRQKQYREVSCKKIVYAGQKHALKYICPAAYTPFKNTTYAPWVVVNFILKKNADFSMDRAYWQNEILSEDRPLLGFVDSAAQFTPKSASRVLTMYFCFEPAERLLLANLSANRTSFVSKAIHHLSKYFDRNITSQIERVIVTPMGHAMPIPKPGYLFRDANEHRTVNNMAFAGVDNGRLPLMFEAMDSGIMAARGVG